MSIGCILALGVSALGPAALAVACVFEFMARKPGQKKPFWEI